MKELLKKLIDLDLKILEKVKIEYYRGEEDVVSYLCIEFKKIDSEKESRCYRFFRVFFDHGFTNLHIYKNDRNCCIGPCKNNNLELLERGVKFNFNELFDVMIDDVKNWLGRDIKKWGERDDSNTFTG